MADSGISRVRRVSDFSYGTGTGLSAKSPSCEHLAYCPAMARPYREGPDEGDQQAGPRSSPSGIPNEARLVPSATADGHVVSADARHKSLGPERGLATPSPDGRARDLSAPSLTIMPLDP